VTFSLLVLAEAEPELRAAAYWYDEQRPGLGDDFLTAIHGVIQHIAEKPRAFAAYRDLPDVRRVLLKGFPYAVVFQLYESDVYILSIAHQRRRPRYWAGRRQE
jgi:toxin ParE1/3/4